MQHPSAFGVHVHFLVHTARNRRHMLTLLSSRKNKLSFAKWSVGRVRTYTLILLILCCRSEMRLSGRHKFDHYRSSKVRKLRLAHQAYATMLRLGS